jgi:hypothetical protein
VDKGVRSFWGLTCDFWAENAKKKIKTTADPFGMTTRKANARTTTPAGSLPDGIKKGKGKNDGRSGLLREALL